MIYLQDKLVNSKQTYFSKTAILFSAFLHCSDEVAELCDIQMR